MPTTATGRYHCRQSLPYNGGPSQTCYSALGNVFARTWPADPAEVTAAVAFHGQAFADLLCGTQERGCLGFYSKLVLEGKLPA